MGTGGCSLEEKGRESEETERMEKYQSGEVRGR